jgi:hypothetical protein
MIYSSPREATAPGFDRWYWDVLSALGKAKKLLLVVGAFDSDGTIRELLDEAKRRGVAAAIHFVEEGPLETAYETTFSKLATKVTDLDGFAEKNGIELDSDDDLKFDF